VHHSWTLQAQIGLRKDSNDDCLELIPLSLFKRDREIHVKGSSSRPRPRHRTCPRGARGCLVPLEKRKEKRNK